jgi:hypothetical protein
MGGRGLDDELRRGFCGFPALPLLALAAAAEFGTLASIFDFVRFPFVGDRKIGGRFPLARSLRGRSTINLRGWEAWLVHRD